MERRRRQSPVAVHAHPWWWNTVMDEETEIAFGTDVPADLDVVDGLRRGLLPGSESDLHELEVYWVVRAMRAGSAREFPDIANDDRLAAAKPLVGHDAKLDNVALERIIAAPQP